MLRILFRQHLVILVACILAIVVLLAGSRFTLSSAHAAKFSGTQPVQLLPLSSAAPLAEAISSGSVHDVSLSARLSKADPKLICTPAPCVLPNTQASGGNLPGTRQANEDPIAANPKNGNDLLTGGNDYDCPTLQGFYATSNKGSTWNSTCMSSPPGEIGDGDPGVGYDLNGVAYITGLDRSRSTGALNEIVIERSTDNGVTWSAPTAAVTPVLPGGILDKDWLQVDDNPKSPFANALYVSTTQFAGGASTIAVSHSTDGGMTWTTATVDTVQAFPQIDQFSDLAISDEGLVYVSWMRCSATGPRGGCGGSTATFYVSQSSDGGTTWSTPSSIATAHLAPNTCGAFYGCLPNTGERVSDIPAIGTEHADIENAASFDSLHAAFNNWTGTFMQVEVATSLDGGVTWSSPIPVAPATDTHDQFFPWLSVSEDGTIAVSWLDRRNDPANHSYEAFVALSKNAGSSFGANIQLATTPSNPNNDGFFGRFMGDYTGSSWSDETLYVSWMDSRNGLTMQDEVGGYRLAG